jgi:formylmethanofuran dehydrogenase subunit C
LITLRLREQPTVPLEAESLTPDRTVGQPNDAIRALPVFFGKRQCRLDQFFDVEGADSDRLEVQGDLSRVKWVGREMSRGCIKIQGNAGMHLGAYMRGGTIEVTGNGSDWTGA